MFAQEALGHYSSPAQMETILSEFMFHYNNTDKNCSNKTASPVCFCVISHSKLTIQSTMTTSEYLNTRRLLFSDYVRGTKPTHIIQSVRGKITPRDYTILYY